MFATVGFKFTESNIRKWNNNCDILEVCGFGGLWVACWPLVPNLAGSNPAEAVGFLWVKQSSARLPCRRCAACKGFLIA